MRTLATDLTSSNDYDNYVAQLGSLPKLDVDETQNIQASPRVGRLDSSEDEAMVNKLSSTLPVSDGSKAKAAGMGKTLSFIPFMPVMNDFGDQCIT